jgi:hypothetical protein
MVKPVDLQDNLSKTEHLEKIQQLKKSVPEESQKQFAQEMARKVSDGKSRVSNLPQVDKIIIQHDKRKKKKPEPDKDKRQHKKYKSKNGSVKKINYIA